MGNAIFLWRFLCDKRTSCACAHVAGEECCWDIYSYLGEWKKGREKKCRVSMRGSCVKTRERERREREVDKTYGDILIQALIQSHYKRMEY